MSKNIHKKSFQILDLIEKKLDLSAFKIQGIDVWPHIRSRFLHMYFAKIEGKLKDESYFNRLFTKFKLLALNKNLIFSFFKSIFTKFNFNKLNTKKYLLLTDVSSKRFVYNDSWYDIYTDPLLDDLLENGDDFCILETDNRFLGSKINFRPSIYIQPYILKIFLISFFKKKPNVSHDFLKNYNIYCELLHDFKLDKFKLSLNELRKEFTFIKNLSLFYSKIIDKVKPDLISMIQYSGYHGSGLCYSANKLNISSLDIQHGVQGDLHPTYHFTNFPKSGYNVFPRNFLVWSNHEKDILDKSFENRNSVIISGNLLLNKYKFQTNLSKHFDKLFNNKFKSVLSKKIILISLVWGEDFPDLIKDLITKSSNDYFFLIRIHPSTNKLEFKKLLKELSQINNQNFEYSYTSKLPLHTILRNVNFHVTSVSSVVLEALEFNVKSIVFSERGKNYYQYLADKNKVFYLNNAKSIISFFKTNNSKKFTSLKAFNNKKINYIKKLSLKK